MRQRNFDIVALALAAALATALVSVLAVAVVAGMPQAAPLEEGFPLTSRAAEPVTPHGMFPFQLTLTLVGVFAVWTLVNAVWSAPSDGAVAALRRAGGHPKVDHLYIPVSVGAHGGSRLARLVAIGPRKVGLLSETPIDAGESITIATGDGATAASFHARVKKCHRRDGWFEVEARVTSHSDAERRALNDWMDRFESHSSG